MNLEFSEENNVYVAEAVVNGDYALHIEREAIGIFYMQQKFTGNNFAACSLPSSISNGNWKILDCSFSHGIYPMSIRIKSSSKVNTAVLQEINQE